MLNSLTSDYKDKPPRWQGRASMLGTRLIRSKRLFMLICLAISFYFFGPSFTAIGGSHDHASSSTDEDLYVDKSLYARGLSASIKSAERQALVHPIENVYFLLNGLTSVDTNLVDLACDMARKNAGSTVHIVVLGHGSLAIDNYRYRNGFDEECPVFFHNARPNATFSHVGHTMELASYADHALRMLLRDTPRAIIYTHSATEPKPNWFMATVARHKHAANFIELAGSDILTYGWMSQLSAEALASWNRPIIDLVIDASTSNTGSLQRLLDCLANAIYPADSRPQIIIEFDHDSRVAVRALIAKFAGVWPKSRIQARRKTRETQFVLLESWYPTTADNFALFLNTCHELSPYYYQYLLMMLLRYRYDDAGRLGAWRMKQYGIALTSVFEPSLDAPQMLLDYKDDLSSIKEARSPFLWHVSDIDAPVLLYPELISTLHEVLNSGDDEVEQLTDTAQLLGYLVVPNSMLMLYPPAFNSEEGSMTMARMMPDYTKVDGGAEDQPKTLRLQTDAAWYNQLGGNNGNEVHDDLPQWTDLLVFDANGARQSMSSFFRGNYG